MEIGDAEAAELFSTIGTAFAGANHDGVTVGLLAEIQDLMTGRITLHQKTAWVLKSYLKG